MKKKNILEELLLEADFWQSKFI